ncbi:MAG: hypothetical protein K2Y04_11275 [Caulobacteraceae bacterium]|nr:hypothetical protein [Caulobacteraceae bacterium]
MSRTIEQLIEAFPDLGPHGAREEARLTREQIDPGLLLRLQTRSESRSSEVDRLLRAWTRNSDPVTRFLRTAEAKSETSAWAEAFASATAAGSVYAEGADLDILARGKADLYQQVAELLRDRERADDLGCLALGRGTASTTKVFEARFRVGEVIEWRAPRACSVNLDVVPLFFAWKSWAKVEEVPEQKTAVILNIGCLSGRPVFGHWTGDINGSSPPESYEWQSEVVTAPGLIFGIVRHEQLKPAPSRVVRVTAIPVS